MLEKEFYNWLLQKYGNQGTANSRKTNCMTVCKYEGDLDEHFARNQCQAILSKLEYSTNDEKFCRPPKHKIPINGDIRTGTATLKQAVNLYIKFKKGSKNSGIININKPKVNTNSDWPIWESPTENEIYQFAQITTKYIRFLNPKIVERITQDNCYHNKEWSELLFL
ncbi:hypothetical protein R83H12_01205 [Fibrobacteria bacterium R8-3-H12]